MWAIRHFWFAAVSRSIFNEYEMEELEQRRRVLKWVGIWAVWTLFGFFFASQFALQNQFSRNPVSFWKILLWQMVSGYVWFALSPIVLNLVTWFPLEEKKLKSSVPIHLAASLVIALIQQAIDAFVLVRLGYPPGREFASFAEAYRFFVFINLHLSLLIYWGIVGVKTAYNYYQKYRERELHSSQLEARLAQSRLHVLKMQLHPHFLFNTLNAISELIHKDPDAAERMLGELSDLLRISFESLEVQKVPLKQELEFLEKYLDIEQMRFQDRLRVDLKVDSAALGAQVPNMILQPLVENAIKHGIAPRSSGGRIEIAAARSNGHLDISVIDDGIGVPFGSVESVSDGVGLANTRRRLMHLYGEDHHFSLAPVSEKGGVNVRLLIPFEEI